MTESERQALREAIDEAKRARVGKRSRSGKPVDPIKYAARRARVSLELVERCPQILGPFSTHPGVVCGRAADASGYCGWHRRFAAQNAGTLPPQATPS